MNQPAKKTLGEIAYAAYRDHAKGVSLVNGRPIPPFAELSVAVREGWETAANAVIRGVSKALARTVEEALDAVRRIPAETWTGLIAETPE